jgi:hypothetical protein
MQQLIHLLPILGHLNTLQRTQKMLAAIMALLQMFATQMGGSLTQLTPSPFQELRGILSAVRLQIA